MKSAFSLLSIKLYFSAIGVFMALMGFAVVPASHYAIKSGNWSDPTVWSNSSGGGTCNCLPSYRAYVENGYNVTVDMDVTTLTYIIAQSSATVTISSPTYSVSATNITVTGENSKIVMSAGTLYQNAGTVFSIAAGGELRISGGTISLDGSALTVSGANSKIAMSGGTLTHSATQNNYAFDVSSAGTFSMTAGTVNIGKSAFIVKNTSSSFIMSGGTFNVSSVDAADSVCISDNATATISGGAFRSYYNTIITTGASLTTSSTNTVTINGYLTVSSKGTTNSSLTVNGGSTTVDGVTYLSGGSLCNTSPSLTVSSGTMTITGMLYWQKSSGACGAPPTTTPQLTVSGGYLNLVGGTERSTSGTDVAFDVTLSSGTLETQASFDMSEPVDEYTQTGGTLKFTTTPVKWFNGGVVNGTGGTVNFDTDIVLQDGSASGTWQFHNVSIGVAGILSLNDPSINVSGDWDNSSGGDFVHVNHKVVLNGSANSQNIFSGDDNFYGLTINNTYATIPQIEFKGYNVVVEDALIMTSGKVNLNNFSITLGTSGALPGTLSYTSGWLYGGTFKRWFGTGAVAIGAAAGHFPMGARNGAGTLNHYRPLWISQGVDMVGPSAGTISVTHNAVYPTTYTLASHNDASWGFNLQGVSQSTWSVITANGYARLAATGSIRYGGEGFGDNQLTDMNSSLLASVVGTHSAATGTSTVPYVNRTGLTGAQYTQSWRLGSKNLSTAILPIELIDFNASLKSQDIIESNWQTATETNNDFFTVERSIDAVNFETAGTIKGAGNSQIIQSYTFTDNTWNTNLPKNITTLYYRLKQTDFDGSYSYSNIVAVELSNVINLTLFPNPTTSSNINLNISSSSSQAEILVILYDHLGREAYSKVNIIDNSGPHIIALDVSDRLPAGIYQVVASSKESVVKKKLIIH